MELVGLSLTQGCIVSKPKATSKKSNTGGFIHHASESDREAQKRFQRYEQCWSDISNKIECLINQFEGQCQQDIKDFITNSISLRTSRIPACLVNGYFDISLESFSNLKESLSPITPLVINLQPPTGMKALMKDIFSQLLQLEEDEEPSFTIPECSMATICEWYKSYCQDLEGVCPPVVMVINYIEDFPVQLLCDFIAMLRCRLTDISTVLIFGTKRISSFDIQLLHSSALPHLQLRHIIKDPLQTLIPQTLEMMCFSNTVSVHISPSLCSELLTCLEEQITITAAIKTTIQFHVFEHFYWQPLSFLSSNADIDKDISSMSVRQCEMIRATPSMMRYIESREPKESKDLLENDGHLKDIVKHCISDIVLYYQYIIPVMNCLEYLLNGSTESSEMSKLKQLIDYILNQENNLYIKRLCIMDTYTLQERAKEFIEVMKTRDRLCPKLIELCLLLKDFVSCEQQGSLNDQVKGISEWLNCHLISPTALPLHEVLCISPLSLTKPYRIPY